MTLQTSLYFITTQLGLGRSSFLTSGTSDSNLLPPQSFSSFLHVIVFLSSVTRSPDPLDLPLPFRFLGFHAFCWLVPISFSPVSSSLPITVAEASACQESIELGGGDANLGALPGHPGSTSHWSIFIGVALELSTCWAQSRVVTSRANGVSTRFLDAGSIGVARS